MSPTRWGGTTGGTGPGGHPFFDQKSFLGSRPKHSDWLSLISVRGFWAVVLSMLSLGIGIGLLFASFFVDKPRIYIMLVCCTALSWILRAFARLETYVPDPFLRNVAASGRFRPRFRRSLKDWHAMVASKRASLTAEMRVHSADTQRTGRPSGDNSEGLSGRDDVSSATDLGGRKTTQLPPTQSTTAAIGRGSRLDGGLDLVGSTSSDSVLERAASSPARSDQLVTSAPAAKTSKLLEGTTSQTLESSSLLEPTITTTSRVVRELEGFRGPCEAKVPEECILGRSLQNTLMFRQFESPQFLGEGGFGHVFKARNRLDQSWSAFKVKNYQLAANENIAGIERTFNEVKALLAMQHKHLVTFHMHWCEENQFLPDKEAMIRTWQGKHAEMNKVVGRVVNVMEGASSKSGTSGGGGPPPDAPAVGGAPAPSDPPEDDEEDQTAQEPGGAGDQGGDLRAKTKELLNGLLQVGEWTQDPLDEDLELEDVVDLEKTLTALRNQAEVSGVSRANESEAFSMKRKSRPPTPGRSPGAEGGALLGPSPSPNLRGLRAEPILEEEELGDRTVTSSDEPGAKSRRERTSSSTSQSSPNAWGAALSNSTSSKKLDGSSSVVSDDPHQFGVGLRKRGAGAGAAAGTADCGKRGEEDHHVGAEAPEPPAPPPAGAPTPSSSSAPVNSDSIAFVSDSNNPRGQGGWSGVETPSKSTRREKPVEEEDDSTPEESSEYSWSTGHPLGAWKKKERLEAERKRLLEENQQVVIKAQAKNQQPAEEVLKEIEQLKRKEDDGFNIRDIRNAKKRGLRLEAFAVERGDWNI